MAAHPRGEPHLRLPLLSRGDPGHAVTRSGAHRADRIGERSLRGSALSGPAYAASKGGLLTLARFLAREHAADGITTNAVAPGPHATPMWDALDGERRQRILGMIPGGHGPGSPDDLAATIVHLCSEEARYINGATIDVNGGQWMG